MRVLVASQEFKGTLDAVAACEAIAAGLRAGFSEGTFDLLPMADGGPGTTRALLTALGGEARALRVQDPLGRPVDAEWGMLANGTAVIECAAASGLWRLRAEELDPRRASSSGSGEMVRAALDAGCRDLIFGLGGSATNDGGAGLAQALGFRLLDASGAELPPGGAALAHLDRIDARAAHPGIAGCRVLGATDVTNPLCGPQGASAVYGPQKGADTAAIAELDAALGHYASVIERDMGIDVRERPGAGAAGGLGAAIIAFLGAELRPGAEIVSDAAGLRERIAAADIVITGEGRLDGQTAYGKAPQYVARLARATGRPVICLAGSLGEGHEAASAWFDVIEPLQEPGLPLPSAVEAAEAAGAAALRAVLVLLTRRPAG